MKRRLLEVCLLAYPRMRRERERVYLRDLALDLSDTYGIGRQAISLVRGGLGERIDLRRRNGVLRPPRKKRLVAACTAAVVVVLGASSLVLPAAGEGVRVEVETFACMDACAEIEEVIASRVNEGWDCEAREGHGVTTWRCSLG